MYIDLHSDTVLKYIDGGALYDGNNSKITFKELLENKNKAQYAAIFLPEDYSHFKTVIKSDREYLEIARKRIYESIERDPRIAHAADYREYEENLAANKLSIFTSVEDGRIIEKVEDVKFLRDSGISLVTLLWNNENTLGYPNSNDGEIMTRPLKELGKEVVCEMNERKMIIDVSHLNYGGVADVLEISRYPIVASHSNSAAICPHRRNLPDELIRKIAAKGGVIGLTLCPPFVVYEKTDNILPYLKEHLLHILDVGGEDVIAIGTDFDGIGEEENLPTPGELSQWLENLECFGLTSTQIEKFSHKNLERVLKDVTI